MGLGISLPFEASQNPFITRELGSGTREVVEDKLKESGVDPTKLPFESATWSG